VSNHIRLSMAEWVWRMSQDGVPYQARSLAMHAVLFKVTGNDDLARLSGMDSKGKAEQTFNKWKKFLYTNGWVLLGNTKGGRGMGIEVTPAYRETPVEFTDVSRRDPCKFNPRKNLETGAEITDVVASETGVISTETGVISAPLRSARARDGNNNIINKNNNLQTHTLVEQDAPRDGEEHIGSGVFVNCETVRHKDFTISIKGIEMQLATCSLDMDSEQRKEAARASAIGHALQWAADIENGKKPDRVVPDHTANFIRGSIVQQHTKTARSSRYAHKAEMPKVSNADRIAAAVKRAEAKQKAGRVHE